MIRRRKWLLIAPIAPIALVAAAAPGMLSQSQPGLWEISGAPGSRGVIRQCVGDTAMLAQFEHRSGTCTRVVISQSPSTAVIHYTCTGGGFGRSELTLLTPRALRIETQGISGNAPFHYVLQARRIGDCQRH